MAELTGLLPGTAVAVANVDAHVSVPAVGITEPGKMLMIMGTSTCHVLLGEEEHIVPVCAGSSITASCPDMRDMKRGSPVSATTLNGSSKRVFRETMRRKLRINT